MMITPAIGERYRDTALAITNITHLDRYRAARAQDADRHAARVDLIVRAIKPLALRSGSTIADIERATAAGVDALVNGRSRGYAIAIARRALRNRPSA